MTVERAATSDGGRRGEGTVFDIGYQNYSGPREGRGRARFSIYKNGIRIALGLGRSARSKILPWFFIGLLAAIGLVMALIAGAANRIVGPGIAGQLNLPSHSDYYGIAAIVFFVFSAVVAPELLCTDRREGVINLYLVRPLTGLDYVAARWCAFFTVMLAAAWLPQIILYTGLVMGDSEPLGYFLNNWRDIPKFLGAGLAFATYATTLALLVASFTTRSAYASVFLVGLYLITTPFTVGLAVAMGGVAGQWISMFNLANIPLQVNDVIFGSTSFITSVERADELSSGIRVGWYLLWTVGPAFMLGARYKRLAP